MAGLAQCGGPKAPRPTGRAIILGLCFGGLTVIASFRISLPLVSALISFVTLSGCAPPPTIPDWRGPGFDTYGKTLAMWGGCGDELAIVVWADTEGRASGWGESNNYYIQFSARTERHEGRYVEWCCRTIDGRSGTVVINDSPYDLAEGNLFLVTTTDQATQVHQLKRDYSGVAPTFAGIRSLAEHDLDVIQFIKAASQRN